MIFIDDSVFPSSQNQDSYTDSDDSMDTTELCDRQASFENKPAVSKVKLKFHWLPPKFEVEKVKNFLLSKFSMIKIKEAGSESHQPPLDKTKSDVLHLKIEYNPEVLESIDDLLGVHLLGDSKCSIEAFWEKPQCENAKITPEVTQHRIKSQLSIELSENEEMDSIEPVIQLNGQNSNRSIENKTKRVNLNFISNRCAADSLEDFFKT